MVFCSNVQYSTIKHTILFLKFDIARNILNYFPNRIAHDAWNVSKCLFLFVL